MGKAESFLSVIDVGKISCTGCRSNRKKPFKITFLNRIPVPCTFLHTWYAGAGLVGAGRAGRHGPGWSAGAGRACRWGPGVPI